MVVSFDLFHFICVIDKKLEEEESLKVFISLS